MLFKMKALAQKFVVGYEYFKRFITRKSGFSATT